MDERLDDSDWIFIKRDPDNWINIPEFGVNPVDVGFEGFEHQIYGPGILQSELRHDLWEIAKCVRIQAKARFQSMAKLKEVHQTFVNKSVELGSEFQPLGTCSGDEIFAFRYETIFEHIALCTNRRVDKDWLIEVLAAISVNVSGMMVERPLEGEIVQKYDELRKQALAAAGQVGGKKRSAKYGGLKAWALAEAEKIKGSDKGKARRLAAQLPPEFISVSGDPERLIYDTLRSAKKRS